MGLTTFTSLMPANNSFACTLDNVEAIELKSDCYDSEADGQLVPMIAAAVGISKLRLVFAAVLGLMALVGKAAPTKSSAPQKQGADLLKTDIMAVFAHPDDETGVAATLAYYALGRRAVVANVYCTRGEGGGNMVGTQWGAALATLRETELRDCLAIVGVRFCYFLDQLDW